MVQLFSDRIVNHGRDKLRDIPAKGRDFLHNP